MSHSSTPNPSELTEAVRALARVSRLVERASDGLSFADYRVMAAIVSGEARASRLARRLALGKPAISASIDSLARRGLVVRGVVEGDNRAIALSLSPEGSALIESMESRMSAALAVLSARTDDPAAVIRSLASLGAAIDDAAAECAPASGTPASVAPAVIAR